MGIGTCSENEKREASVDTRRRRELEARGMQQSPECREGMGWFANGISGNCWNLWMIGFSVSGESITVSG
jgi:hypothetical protein